MKKTLLISFITAGLFFFQGLAGFSAVNKQIDADIKTKRVPEGTVIPLKMLDPAGSNSSSAGDLFSASVSEDIKIDDTVVIPYGSVIRGAVDGAKPAGMLYKGGYVRLYFDHIVSLSGRQIPVYAAICNNEHTAFDGALSSKTTYSDAFSKTVSRTKNIAVKPVKWAWRTGDKVLKGVPKYIMAPVTAVFSGIGAGVYFIGDTIADIFKKGKNITVNQNDIIEVQLLKPVDMPVY